MKSLTASILVFGILGFNSIMAQEDVSTDEIKIKKHEINIGFTNLFSPNQDYYDPYYPLYSNFDKQSTTNANRDLLYYPHPLTPAYDRTQFGLGYKFHFGKNAARLMMSFMADNEESDNEPQGDYEYDNSTKSNIFSTRVGMEHTFVQLKKLDFYLALDGIYKSAESKNESSSYYYVYNDRTESTNTDTYTAYGAGLGIGLRFYVHENLSFSTETHIDYISQTFESKNEYSNSGTNSYNYSSSNKTVGNNTRVNPFAVLSVNVHF